jgi:hypothetical protein
VLGKISVEIEEIIMSDLKWIACEGVSLNPYNLSVPERLRSFGYALVFDEFGNGKTDKAQLCIHHIITAIDNENAMRSRSEAEKSPNILIICPESLLQNWYSSLVSEMGADFKFISDLGDTVSFYSKSMSNLLIISAEQLKQSKQVKQPGMSVKMESQGITGDSKQVWDLMIIDASASVAGADWEGYYENCSNKAHKILVFAPNPFPYDEDLSSSMLKRMLRRFLYDPDLKNAVAGLEIDENILLFDKSTPALRYCIPGKTKGRGPNVITLEYQVNKNLFNTSNRLADTRAGLPSYVFGGNVFEEYNPALKSTYMLAHYDKDDVELLREADAKLAVFLEKLDAVLKIPENNAVVYFACNNTLNYIYKVINTVYADMKDQIVIQTESFLDVAFLKRRFAGGTPVKARIILASDLIDEKYYGISNATHVFNYEYPTTPDELERRFLRTGRSRQIGLSEVGNSRPEEFIIFTDKDMKFDGRVLSKVMMSRLPTCFKKKIPSRNVLFWVNGAENYMAQTLSNLKRVSQKAQDTKTDFMQLSRRFCKEYNVIDPTQVDTAEKLAEYAEHLFDDLIRLLDVNNAAEVFALNLQEHIGEDSTPEIVKKSIETIRRGYLYYDDLMNPRLIKNTNNPVEIARKYEDNEFAKGIEKSMNLLESMLDRAGTEKYPFIRNEIAKLPDGLKSPVLYNIWKYCRFNKGYTQSLKEFMELYNKGVI